MLGKPRSNPTYFSAPNGCGSYDFKIDFEKLKMHGVTKCCNEHDTCYATCNEKKIDCDNEFKKCLLNFCNDKKKQIKIDLLESSKYYLSISLIKLLNEKT